MTNQLTKQQKRILDHYKNPRNYGKPGFEVTHKATVDNLACGDSVAIYLRIIDNKVEDIAFEAEGCSIAIATASLFTEAIKSTTDASSSTVRPARSNPGSTDPELTTPSKPTTAPACRIGRDLHPPALKIDEQFMLNLIGIDINESRKQCVLLTKEAFEKAVNGE